MGTDILKGLNKSQIEAVTTTEGYVRVIAGAGSGKTKALTTRYAYLVDECDISPSKILSVTFTNKAANEMKERIRSMLGDIPTPYIMTFHGFCNKFLRSEIEAMGISTNFKIMDTDDQTDILKVIYKELGITIKQIPYKRALNDIIGKGYKFGKREFLQNYEELFVECSSADFHQKMLEAEDIESQILYGYLREQKRDACLDFEDLLNFTLYLLKTRKYIGDSWQDAFSYIQVDEFQDVSLREVELVSILSKKCGNLFVVGDDSQCVVEGTQIETIDGMKNVEDIQIGDKVRTARGNGKTGCRKVTAVMKKLVENGTVFEVKTKTGSVLRITGEHQVFANTEDDMDKSVTSNNLLCYFANTSIKDDNSSHTFNTKDVTYTFRDFGEATEYALESKEFKMGLIDIGANICGSLSYLHFVGELGVGDLIPVISPLEKGLVLEEIVDIQEVPYSGYVYDLNVADTHNYIAEGVLVHNCIYSFRGADVNCIVKFEEIMNQLQNRKNKITTVYMVKNYRSTPEILDVSNSLIKHNVNRLDKDLIAENPNGTRVLYHHSKNVYRQADWVVQRILSLHRPYSDFAILYRQNSSSRVIEEKLVENSIPYQIFSGISFYARKEIKDVLAVLSLIAFEDNLSFNRLVKTLSLGIGNKKIETLKELSGEKATLYMTLKMNKDIKIFKNTKANWLISFIETMKGYAQTEKLSNLISRIFMELNLEETYMNSGELDRWENLQELKRSAQHYERSQAEKVEIADYLGILSLYTNTDREDKENSVKLMTIHGSKGLEFPVVFVIDMNEGVIPSGRTTTVAMMEEERRIAYVAMTRAKELLFFSDAEGENYDNTNKLPSRFLLNIKRDLYDTDGTIDLDLFRQTERLVQSDSFKLQDLKSDIFEEIANKSEFKEGTEVIHSHFGKGTILKVEDDYYAIMFENVGLKGIRKDTTKLKKVS